MGLSQKMGGMGAGRLEEAGRGEKGRGRGGRGWPDDLGCGKKEGREGTRTSTGLPPTPEEGGEEKRLSQSYAPPPPSLSPSGPPLFPCLSLVAELLPPQAPPASGPFVPCVLSCDLAL